MTFVLVLNSSAQVPSQKHLPEGATLRLGKGTINGIEYSPDGTQFAVAGSIGIWIYDAHTYQEIDLLTESSEYVWSIAFSPDGRTLAGANSDGRVRLWDVETGQRKAALTGSEGCGPDVAFSPDGRTLATGGYGGVWLWDVGTGRHKATLRVNRFDAVWSVAFSPDGRTLAAGSSRDGTIWLWDAKTEQHKATLEGHTITVRSVAFSPDGQTLASAGGSGVRLWNVNTGQHKAILEEQYMISVAFSPDSQTLAVPHIRGVGLWDVTTGQHKSTLGENSNDFVDSVAFSPDGQTLASASWGGTGLIWDVETGQQKAILEGHTDAVDSILFSPDGRTLTSPKGRGVWLWDVDTGQHKSTLAGPLNPVKSVAFSSDGRTLASGSFGGVWLWDASTGQHKITLIGPNNANHQGWKDWKVSFSPDGQTLATGSRGEVRLWDVSTGQQKTILQNAEIDGRLITYSPDGRTLATRGIDGTMVRLWDTFTEKPIRVFKGHGGRIDSMAFSPDGSSLAAGSPDDPVLLWDVGSGQLKETFQGLASCNFSFVCFSPNGDVLVSGWRGYDIALWNVATGKQLTLLAGHGHQPLSAAFNPNGNILATGSSDGTVLLWDVAPFVTERRQQDIDVEQTRPDTDTQQTQQDTGIQPYQRERVRLIYFRPSDRSTRQDIDTKLDALIRWTQHFFAEQLQEFGNRKTFAFETQPTGHAQVHHVTGKFKDTYYHHDTYNKVVDEVAEQFDTSKDVLLIAADVSSEFINQEGTCGIGGGGWRSFDNKVWQRDFGGVAVVPASGACTTPVIAAHELGHVFGLEHDFRDNAYLMGYSTQQRLSQCAAGWLDAHRFFNDDPSDATAHNAPATIAMHTSRIGTSGNLQLRFELTDPDGLHHAQLLVRVEATDPAPGLKLHSCQSLSGKNQTITFVRAASKVAINNEVTLQVIDINGNITKQTFSIPVVDDTVRVSDAFDDPFAGTALQNPNWRWRNEPANWDVGETRANFLHIESEINRDLWVSDTSHLLYQETDADTFDVETHFFARWDTDSGVNGLVVKSPTDDNWVTLKFWARDPGAKGHIQYQTKGNGHGKGLTNDAGFTPTFGNTELFFRLRKQGNAYTGWYKTNKAAPWIEIGTTQIALTPPLQVGLYAGVAAGSGTLNVDYGYFRSTVAPGGLAAPRLQFAAIELPRETTLLPNYPNPFNPETWIPYQLSSPSDVTVHIYAVNGHLVRRLPLGYQPAGMYQTRSRAVYWDGTNEIGEPVASGVYFYTLTTGDFTATRKMLIRK